ncbi:complement component C6 [Pelobates cultripes]|uniref:Complement component C6 n=1 Tax=Pelobates cultripes TaxID=61616 RepID=A0AAD1SE88_PELCU|nr:complement component C6 [Pelobates cultripes]
MKKNDLWLSDVFLKALNNLPLEYNYPLYSRIFDDFGTHYVTGGTLGGSYDLLYQFSSEDMKSSGLTESESVDCTRTETTYRIFFFKKKKVKQICITNKMSERYQGRCIPLNLRCNGDNDCGDNSDERNCRKKIEPKRSFESIPGILLVGNGYNYLSGESRGEIFDNTFYGGKLVTVSGNETGPNRKLYRLPANLESIKFQSSVQDQSDHFWMPAFFLDPMDTPSFTHGPIRCSRSQLKLLLQKFDDVARSDAWMDVSACVPPVRRLE